MRSRLIAYEPSHICNQIHDETADVVNARIYRIARNERYAMPRYCHLTLTSSITNGSRSPAGPNWMLVVEK